MTDGYTEADLYNQLDYTTLLDLLAEINTVPAPEPIKLTQEQWEQVKACVGPPQSVPPFGPRPDFFAVPIRIVECLEDSTPYQQQRPRSLSPQDVQDFLDRMGDLRWQQ